MEEIRNDPFWKDNHIYCDVCGGSESYSCRCSGGPRGPKFSTGKYDQPHRDELKSN
nr:hypothetical protein [uncultured Mediterranean phage uvMED]